MTSNPSGVQQASQPTSPEQMAARYDVLIASGGAFEVRDTLIVFHDEQAKNAQVVGTDVVRRYQFRGDTLALNSTQPWESGRTNTVRITTTFVRQH